MAAGQHYRPALLRPCGAVGVYVDIIITGAAQHQRIDTATVMGKKIKAVTVPAERDSTAFT